jgi:ribonuclease BN (tRNA processing enzyme)
VLGCHGSDQLIADSRDLWSCHSCGFLINDVLLLDAGTICAKLTLEQQLRIQHVLLSHLHFDHIKDLPLLADNVAELRTTPIVVAGIPQVLNGLKAHVFNEIVYPNFFRLPTATHPILTSKTLEPRKMYQLSGLEVTPITVNHLVPTAGFLISDGVSSVLYGGDTYVTEEIWDVAAQTPSLKAVFIEASFPNEEAELARVSKHLTPSLLAQGFEQIRRPDLPVYVYHMKPRYRDRIIKQLGVLGIGRLSVLKEGQTLLIDE